MSTSIIAGGDAPLVFENAEYVFGFVTLGRTFQNYGPHKMLYNRLIGWIRVRDWPDSRRYPTGFAIFATVRKAINDQTFKALALKQTA